MRVWQTLNHHPLELAALCGLVGLLSFYHRNYDNIMLFPALLAAWRASLREPHWGNLMITLLLALSGWTPGTRSLRVLIWSLSCIWLLWHILASPRPWNDAPILKQKLSATPAAVPADDS